MIFCPKERSVVKLPGPAIKGNANGNMDAVTALVSSSLYKVMPKIISRAIKNKMNAPATAKELTPMPISDNRLFPKKQEKYHDDTGDN